MKNHYLLGLRHGLPIGLGYLSVSFAFGIYAITQGLAVWETLLISMTNLTSAGQLAGVPILATGGSLAELAATQLTINLRYALMSVSLSQKLDNGVRLRDRLLISFANTDEVFAVASSRPGLLDRVYLYGLIALPYVGWTLGTLLGALAGSILPASVISALGIMIYGMFIAIIVPAARQEAPVALCVLVAVGISCALYYLPLPFTVSSGVSVIISSVSASALLAWLRPIPEQSGKDGVDA